LRKYPPEVIAQVLAAVDIVDIVGAVVDLKPSGSNRYVALCPFHQEKTPSFHVTREKQKFYCFGCQKGGDVIAFLREFEGLSFNDALRRLAERAGIRLPATTERTDNEEHLRARLLELNNVAAKFFQNYLSDPLKGSVPRHYLAGRTLSIDTVKRFGIGYAPDDYDSLVLAVKKAGFKDDVLLSSGLVRRGEHGKLYSFFRHRLMIPIRDTAGRIIAFGGRDLSGDATNAKYINTPENPIYQKGRELFGLYEARNALRQEKCALLVEGYFDLMRCFDSGIENVVATCGTALTIEQATRLRRHVPEVIVVYDGDAAGIRAALRGVALLTAAGLSVRALVLPDGNDPDDFIKKQGADAFKKLLSAALDFVSFYIRMNSERTETVEGRTEIARELFTILHTVNDPLRREEYLKRISRELRVDFWSLQREFHRIQEEDGASNRFTSNSPTQKKNAVNLDDCAFIAALLQSEPLRTKTREALADTPMEPGPLKDVLDIVLNEKDKEAVLSPEDENASALLAAAANSPSISPDHREALVEKRIKRLKHEALNACIKKNSEAIRKAEENRDTELIKVLIARQIELKKQAEKIGAT